VAAAAAAVTAIVSVRGEPALGAGGFCDWVPFWAGKVGKEMGASVEGLPPSCPAARYSRS